MPQNQFQRMVFAFLTVVFTVHAFVFYNLYVVNGASLRAIAEASGAQGVLAGISAQGGVMMFGHMLPIWGIILIEFCFAYLLENVLGSPLSFRLACRVFDPRRNHPMLFESAIICATVGIMCPSMSFIAAWMYYPYYEGFHLLTLLANWLRLICFNFPFAYFSQMFFIQPLVRMLFRALFRKQIAAREAEQKQAVQAGGEPDRPADETEAIADICRRIDEIQERLEHERRKRKELQEKIQ